MIQTSENTTIGDEDVNRRRKILRTSLAAASSPAVTAGLHGIVLPFDGNQEGWVEYAEQLECYFVANDISDIAKRKAILINGV